jgi:ketosteroid isomerase-like protein
MSQENVEVVQRVFEIVQESAPRGDHGAAFDEALREGLIAPGMRWGSGRRGGPATESVAGGFYDLVGREGHVELMRSWTEDFEDFVVEPEAIIDADHDRVVGIHRWHGTGKGSRVPVEMRIAVVYTLKGGRIERLDLFLEPNHALQAVGLRERAGSQEKEDVVCGFFDADMRADDVWRRRYG